MYRLNLEHHFAAAHQLTHAYAKECNENVHGHNWRVLIEINTSQLTNGMVVDFKKLKEIINELDHKNLNTILDFEPTAENLSKYIREQIVNVMKELQKTNEEALPPVTEVSVTVFEADKASITYYQL
jgi:6-pyruvoyltetrahydropterin/6-carboxytetrahydropterin synthase